MYVIKKNIIIEFGISKRVRYTWIFGFKVKFVDALAHLFHTNKDRYNLSTKIFRLWELSPYWTPNMFPFEKLPTTPQPTKNFKYFKNDGDMAQLNVQTMFVSSKHFILRVGRHSVVKKYLNAFLLFWYLMTINLKKEGDNKCYPIFYIYIISSLG